MPLLVLLAACAERVSFEDPLPPDGLPRGSPTPEERVRFEAASAYSLDHGGQDLVIVRGDEVVFEASDSGYARESAHHLFSGTKTFACLVAQAAVARGDVESLDEPVGDAFPAILDPADPRRADLTVRHLLTFTSGLEEDQRSLTRDGLLVDQDVEDKVALAASQPLVTAPGSTFDYGSVHLWVFAGWFAARTGRDPVEYLDEHVFGPIGFAHAEWIRDPSGSPALAYGAWTTAGQWARVGILLRDDGAWEGTPILEPGAVAECATGSEANPAYGLTMWLNRETDATLDPVGHTLADDGPILDPDGPEDLFTAAGAQDQRLYVIPSEDLVIARLGSGSLRFRDPELLGLALRGEEPAGCDHTGAPGVAGLLGALLALGVRARGPTRTSRSA